MSDKPSPLSGLGRGIAKTDDGKTQDGQQADQANKPGVGKIRNEERQAPGPEIVVGSTGGEGLHRMVIIGGVMALVIGCVIGAALIFGRSPDPKIARPQIVTGAKIGLNSEEEIRAFTRSTSQQMAELKQSNELQKQAQEDLRRRLDQMEVRNKELIDEVVAKFNAAANEKMKTVEAALAEQRRLADELSKRPLSARDASAADIMRKLQSDLATGKLTKLEATERARAALLSAGYTEKDIRNMLAESKTQAGLVAVGDIAEPPPTKAELDAVHPALRPFIEEGRNYVSGIAAMDRILDERTVKAKLKGFLSAKTSGAQINDQDLNSFYVVTRVRRQNIPDEFQERIPALVKQRELIGIKPDDWRGIADMIWQNRSMFGDVLPPGQLLSLVQIISRNVGAVSSAPATSDSRQFAPINDVQMGILGQVVDQALANNWSMGNRDEAAMIVIATKVVASFLENSRTSMDDGKRVDFISNRVSSFLSQRRGTTEAMAQPRPAPGGPGFQPTAGMPSGPGVPPATAQTRSGMPSGPATPVQEPKIETGGLSISRARLQSAIYLMTPSILTAAGIKPASDEAMAATIVLWEQNRRLTDMAFPEASTSKDGLASATQVLVPMMIEIAKAGAGLTSVKVGHADQRLDPDNRTVMVAYLASQVGPVIHDYQIAAKAVNDVDAALRSANPPDLTQARKALAAARNASKPE